MSSPNNTSLSILQRHRDTWNKKKILRHIYTQWYRQITHDLQSGPTLELGSGGGNFKQFNPQVIASDIDFCPWLDVVFDAHHIPFKPQHIGNIVMIDVLHHLADPVLFLQQAYTHLQPNGRILIIEPFPSPFSLPIYRKVHPEPFIINADLFNQSNPTPTAPKDPWDSNQATAYLLFFKHKNKFDQVFGSKYRIIKKKRISCILYPASGGFENKSLIPNFAIPFFKALEFLLIPFRPLIAFRTYIVLEKKEC